MKTNDEIGASVEPLRKGFVRLTDVLARLEQGFGANSAPVTTIKRHFEMQAQPAQHAITTAAGRAGSVYVSGPMTGYADWNFPAFNAAAAALRAQGLQVINPADHGVVDGAEWADYLRTDLAHLAACERLHLLPGWSKSKGAKLELHVAQALGLQITLAEGAEPLGAAAPQAVQAAVPLPLLLRDIARDLGITVPQACIALKPLGNYSTNSAVTAEMARMLRDHFPAPAHPAEGVPAQVHSALTDARAVLLSINRGDSHRVKVGDDVCYWQRDEWVQWAINEVLPMVDAALAATHPTQQGLAQDAERYRMMRDRAEFLDNAKHCIFERDGREIHGLLQGNDLDVVMDAALAAQAKQGEQANG